MLNEEDLLIEKGEIDPQEENIFYPRGVLNILNMVFEDDEISRPRGKESPTFSTEEIKIIADILFIKPPNIVLKVYSRVPRRKGLVPKRMAFINNYFGDAKFNGAKAARMTGYSKRSAKQIAYKIKQS